MEGQLHSTTNRLIFFHSALQRCTTSLIAASPSYIAVNVTSKGDGHCSAGQSINRGFTVKINLLAIVIAVCLEVERKHRIKLSGFENERSRILAKNILLAQLPCCRIGEATGAWEDANAWRREERMRHI